jgi:hypothetical protein
LGGLDGLGGAGVCAQATAALIRARNRKNFM